MRLSTRIATLCVGLFVSHQAAAADGFYPGNAAQ